jgi:hypothetical protein
MRPFHDSPHTSITNGAAAGEAPHALMTRSGHSDLKTTQGYIDLAGVAFPEETAKRSQRLWGTGRKNQSKVVDPLPVEATVGKPPIPREWPSAGASTRDGAAQESNLPSAGLRRRTGFEDQLGHRPPPLRGGH